MILNIDSLIQGAIELGVSVVEVLERQGGGQNGVDEVEEFGLAGELVILDFVTSCWFPQSSPADENMNTEE